MGEVKNKNTILFEVELNGVRIFPPTLSTDIDLDIDKKFMSNLDFSKVEVERFDVSYGEGGFFMELVVFDPTMHSIDVLLYGLPFSQQSVRVVLGWRYKEGVSKRVFEGLLKGVIPEIVAGGIRYSIEYFFTWWADKGTVSPDDTFLLSLHCIDDKGFVRGGHHLSNIDDYYEKDYDSFVLDFNNSFTMDFIWDLLDVPLFLTSNLMYKYKLMVDERLTKDKNASKDITVKINGTDYTIFKYKYIKYVCDILSKKIEERRDTVIAKMDDFIGGDDIGIFPVFPLTGYGVRASEDGHLVYSRKMISFRYNAKKEGGVKYGTFYDIKNRKVDYGFYNSVNVLHLVMALAAAYNIEIRFDKSLMAVAYDMPYYLESFMAHHVIPLAWFHVQDFYHMMKSYGMDMFNRIIDRMFYFGKDECPSNITVKGKITDTADSEGHRNWIACQSWLYEVFKRAVTYALRTHLGNEEFNYDKFIDIWGLLKKVGEFEPEKDLLKLPESFMEKYGGGYLNNLVNMSFFNPYVINKTRESTVLEFIQDLIQRFGIYSDRGIKIDERTDEEVEQDKSKGRGGRALFFRMYASIGIDKKTGNQYIKISGEPKKLVINVDTHVFSFPRQSDDSDVIEFRLISDKELFLPFEDNNISTEFFSINSAISRLTESQYKRITAFDSDTVRSTFDKVIVDRMKRASVKTNELYEKMLLSGRIYEFPILKELKPSYDLASAVRSFISFFRSRAIQAEMVLLGNVDLDLFEYIFVNILKPDDTMHHLSGVYMITNIEHSLNGAQFITSLSLYRMTVGLQDKDTSKLLDKRRTVEFTYSK